MAKRADAAATMAPVSSSQLRHAQRWYRRHLRENDIIRLPVLLNPVLRPIRRLERDVGRELPHLDPHLRRLVHSRGSRYGLLADKQLVWGLRQVTVASWERQGEVVWGGWRSRVGGGAGGSYDGGGRCRRGGLGFLVRWFVPARCWCYLCCLD